MTIFTRLQHGITSSCPEETEAIGAELAQALPDNCLLALDGPIGAGKTTLVKGLARGLSITNPITSPTYQIFATYQGTRQLLHMDAYRIQSNADLDSLYLDDILTPPFLIALEWPSHAPALLDDFPSFRLQLRGQTQNFKICQQASACVANLKILRLTP